MKKKFFILLFFAVAAWVGKVSAQNDPNNFAATSSVASSRTFCSVKALPYTEDFESGVGDWVLSGIFEVGSPTNTTDGNSANNAHGGSNTLVTDANANYRHNIAINVQTAISPTIDCSGYSDVQLKFYSWSRFEGNNHDWGTVSYSIDGGTTWQQTGTLF